MWAHRLVQLSVVASLVGFGGLLLFAQIFPRSPLVFACFIALTQWPLGLVGWLLIRGRARPGEETLLRVRLEGPGRTVASVSRDGSADFGPHTLFRRYRVTFDNVGGERQERLFAVKATLFSAPQVLKYDGNTGHPRAI